MLLVFTGCKDHSGKTRHETFPATGLHGIYRNVLFELCRDIRKIHFYSHHMKYTYLQVRIDDPAAPAPLTSFQSNYSHPIGHVALEQLGSPS